MKNPRLAFYANHLRFIGGFINNDEENIDVNQHQDDDFKNMVTKIILQYCPFLEARERERWIHGVLTKCPDTSLALMLAMFTNLKTIHLRLEPAFPESKWAYLINAITKRYSEQCGTKAWPKLSSASIRYCDRGIENIHGLSAFAQIPSLRELDGYMIWGKGYKENLWPPGGACSEVTDISLDICEIDMKCASSFFKGFKNLKSLAYHCANLNDLGWDPDGVCRALLASAHKSLEVLELSAEQMNYQPPKRIGSLRKFERLRHLVLNKILFEQAKSDKRSKVTHNVYEFAEMLPASLEVIIFWDTLLECQDSVRLIMHLLEQKHDYLPNLRRIEFGDLYSTIYREDMYPEEVEADDLSTATLEAAGFESACIEAGVECVLRGGCRAKLYHRM